MNTILVDEDWYIVHHPGRVQPWTVQHRLNYKSRVTDRMYLGYETRWFCRTLEQAKQKIEGQV